MVNAYSTGTGQNTTTFSANTQTLGCQGSVCTIAVVETSTITGFTTTYTDNGTAITVIQTGSTWTTTFRILVTQPTTRITPATAPSENFATPIGLALLAVIIVAAVAIQLSKRPKDTFNYSLADERVLKYLEARQGEISVSQASRDLKLSESQLKESLSRLSEKGVIRKE